MNIEIVCHEQTVMTRVAGNIQLSSRRSPACFETTAYADVRHDHYHSCLWLVLILCDSAVMINEEAVLYMHVSN